jgi:hypothetical protein
MDTFAVLKSIKLIVQRHKRERRKCTKMQLQDFLTIILARQLVSEAVSTTWHN